MHYMAISRQHRLRSFVLVSRFEEITHCKRRYLLVHNQEANTFSILCFYFYQAFNTIGALLYVKQNVGTKLLIEYRGLGSH